VGLWKEKTAHWKENSGCRNLPTCRRKENLGKRKDFSGKGKDFSGYRKESFGKRNNSHSCRKERMTYSNGKN